MSRSEDWTVGVRNMAVRDSEFRAGLTDHIRELLTTGNDEDRQAARRLAKDILELEFDTDEELLAQLRESIAA